MRSRRFRIAVAVFLLVYVGSYFVLSRCGTAIARQYNAEGFLYVPCSWEACDGSRTLETLHYSMVAFYFPVWSVDHYVFGGPHWSHIPMFHIDGPSPPLDALEGRDELGAQVATSGRAVLFHDIAG
jgi:hypothetical protein